MIIMSSKDSKMSLAMTFLITILSIATPIPTSSSSNSSKLSFPSHHVKDTESSAAHKSISSLPIFHRTHPRIRRHFDANSVAPFGRVSANEALFYVEVLVGTPSTYEALVFDTGSSFTWLRDSDSYYPYNASTSIKAVRCNERLCKEAPNSNYCENDDVVGCVYNLTYPDGTTSIGDVVSDDFFMFEASETTGKPLHPSPVAVPMVFGAEGGTGKKRGVMGVSTHPLVLITAMDVDIFSVCFPRPTLPPLTDTTVKFGRNACVSGDPTPFDPMEIYKWVFDVESITIAGAELTFPPGPGAKFIFDTGTAVTRLNGAAMDGVLQLVKQNVKATPMAYCADGFELCYEGYYKPAYKSLSVSFRLKGGLSLDFEFGNIWRGYGGSYFALAFKRSSSQKSIFGVQQMLGWNIRVDTRSKELYFDKIDCTY